ASPWSCRDWPVRPWRPPPTEERSLSATSCVTVEEWLLASTPMEDSLASRSLDGTPSSLAISYTRGLLNQISLPCHHSSGAPAGPPTRSTFGSADPPRRRRPPPRRSPSGLVGRCAPAPPGPGRLAARTGRRHGRAPCRSGRRRPSRQANARSRGGDASRSSNGIPHRYAAAPAHHLQRPAPARAFPPPPPCPPARLPVPSAPRALARLLGGLALAHDVDPPAGQPSGQPGILALFPDGQRELVVGHDHVRGPFRLVDLHALDLGRRASLGHGLGPRAGPGQELGRVVRPGQGFHLRPAQLVDHHAHPRPAGADAGALGVDAGLVAADGGLGPGARVPGPVGGRGGA